jgi:hypothetical protein
MEVWMEGIYNVLLMLQVIHIFALLNRSMESENGQNI